MIAHAYISLMPVNNILGKPQTQSSSSISFRRKKRFKQPGKRLGGNSVSVISYRNL